MRANGFIGILDDAGTHMEAQERSSPKASLKKGAVAIDCRCCPGAKGLRWSGDA